MFILDDILLAPIKGVVWLGRKVQEVAERELSDEERLKEMLMELQLRFELDEINEEEYKGEEEEILEHLEAVRSAKGEEV